LFCFRAQFVPLRFISFFFFFFFLLIFEKMGAENLPTRGSAISLSLTLSLQRDREKSEREKAHALSLSLCQCGTLVTRGFSFDQGFRYMYTQKKLTQSPFLKKKFSRSTHTKTKDIY